MGCSWLRRKVTLKEAENVTGDLVIFRFLLEKRAPVIKAFLHALLIALVARLVVAAAFGEVGLRDVRTLEVVAVLVAFVTERLFCALAAGAAQMPRDGEGDAFLHFLFCSKH